MITKNSIWKPDYGPSIKLKYLSDKHLNNIIKTIKENQRCGYSCTVSKKRLSMLPFLEKMQHQRKNPRNVKEKFNNLCAYIYQE